MKSSKFSAAMVVCLLLTVTVLSLSVYAAPPANWPKSISVAAGAVGTGQYSLVVGMANLISKHVGVNSVPEASSVGGRTLHQLNNKEVEFAVSFCDQAYEAGRGLGPYKKVGKMNVRQVWMGAVSPFAMVTSEASGVKSFADLKEKRVMDRYSGNLTYEGAMKVFMEAEGFSESDVKHTAFTGWKDGASALKENRIAAFIHPMPSQGMAAWLKQLSMEIPVKLFSVDEKKLDRIQDKYKFMKKCTLTAKDYGNLTDNKDVVTISPHNSMFCRAELPEDLVYEVMKAVFDHLPDLYAYHKDVKEWTDNPLAPGVLPLHPGVIKYWKEKGRWTAGDEKLQKQLLAEIGATR